MDTITTTPITQAEDRERFSQWLMEHGSSAAKLPLEQLIELYGGLISTASAYRVAVRRGLRGKRLNRTKHSAFWKAINWDLPDSVLGVIWGVRRQHLRQRRLRTGIGLPVFHAIRSASSSQFLAVVHEEKRRSKRFTGPKPR